MRRALFFASLFVAVGIATAAGPASVFAATLSFSAPATVSIGETFTLNVVVNSTDRGFNAGEAMILFPNNVLEVVSIDTLPSSTIFNFWLSSPSFSNDKGRISFSGGTTRGVMGPAVQILSLHMRAKGSGDALITAGDASINASDGSGTNILDGITALRIVVGGASVIVPPKTPVPTNTLTPTPQPILQSASSTQVQEKADDEACVGTFFKCTLHFPVVNEVSVKLHNQVGADLFVSGVASEGNHVHLVLSHDDVQYKEVVAIVQEDRTWNANLSNIHEYGTYSLAAWVENTDSDQRSDLVTQDNIDVYPPFTLHPFGYVLRWYAVVTAALGVLVGIAAAVLFFRFIRMRKTFRFGPAILILSVLAVAFLVMLAFAYILWQREYSSQNALWKDSDIPCVLRAPAFFETYGSVQLSILLDGRLQVIPSDIGFSPRCVAAIHTHDETGHLYVHPSAYRNSMTLLDFFTVAGEPLERDGYTVSVTINGTDHTSDIGAYALQNGDAAVVTYTTIPPQKGK